MGERLPLKGDAAKLLRGLKPGKTEPEAIWGAVGAVRRRGIPDEAIEAEFGRLGGLASFGLTKNQESGRIEPAQRRPQSREQRRPQSLSDQARAIHAEVLTRLAPVILVADLARLSVGKKHGVSPQPKAAARQLDAAVASDDWQMASRIVSATPAIESAKLHQRKYDGTASGFTPIEHSPSLVANVAQAVVPAGWKWSEGSPQKTHTWVQSEIEGQVVPLIVEAVELGTSHTVFSAPSQANYERTVDLAARHLFVPDQELVELFDITPGTLPSLGDSEAKPDQSGELPAFIEDRGPLLAPSIGLLVVNQEFRPLGQ
jgi:hypothetical protein